MGVCQASMVEAMQSLRDEFQTMKKASEAGVDQTFASASKPGTSKQTDDLSPPNQNPNTQQTNTQASEHADEPMEMDFSGPSLPPFGQSAQSKHGSDPNRSDHHSKQSKQPEQVCSARAKKTLGQKKA